MRNANALEGIQYDVVEVPLPADVETNFGGTNPNDIVSRGWLRVSHRQLDEALSRPDRPVHTHRYEEKLVPGEVVSIEIELLPSATLFREGETLRVIVQGVAIQPDAALLQFLPRNQGMHRIWAGGRYDSHQLMPVLDTHG